LLERVIQITSASAIIGQTATIRQYEYDPVGNITKISDNEGNTLDLKYSPTRRLIEFVDGDGVVLYADNTQKASDNTQQSTDVTPQNTNTTTEQSPMNLRPEGPFDFISKIRQWRADAKVRKEEAKAAPSYGYGSSFEVFGMGGVSMFWLSADAGGGGTPRNPVQFAPHPHELLHVGTPPQTPPLTMPVEGSGLAYRGMTAESIRQRQTWQEQNSGSGVLMFGTETSFYAGAMMNASNGFAIDGSGISAIESTALGVTPGIGISNGRFIGVFPDMSSSRELEGLGVEGGGTVSIPIPGLSKVDVYFGLERAVSFGGPESQNYHGWILLAGVELGVSTGTIFDRVSPHGQRSTTTVSNTHRDITLAALTNLRPFGIIYQAGRLVVEFFRGSDGCPE